MWNIRHQALRSAQDALSISELMGAICALVEQEAHALAEPRGVVDHECCGEVSAGIGVGYCQASAALVRKIYQRFSFRYQKLIEPALADRSALDRGHP